MRLALARKELSICLSARCRWTKSPPYRRSSIFKGMIFGDVGPVGFEVGRKDDLGGDFVEAGFFLFAGHGTRVQHFPRRCGGKTFVNPIHWQRRCLGDPLTKLDRLVGLFAGLAAGVKRKADYPADQAFCFRQRGEELAIQIGIAYLIRFQRTGPRLAGVADGDADPDGAEVDSRQTARRGQGGR